MGNFVFSTARPIPKGIRLNHVGGSNSSIFGLFKDFRHLPFFYSVKWFSFSQILIRWWGGGCIFKRIPVYLKKTTYFYSCSELSSHEPPLRVFFFGFFLDVRYVQVDMGLQKKKKLFLDLGFVSQEILSPLKFTSYLVKQYYCNSARRRRSDSCRCARPRASAGTRIGTHHYCGRKRLIVVGTRSSRP